ncbi:hypothetical protein [Fuerstiella marisgermanici]|uniref:Uncharacterized protein n=1 Tax=Fuerstiella marisgermanici TaxID=1891926 RepID=A0A1P8WGJ1_9PLAN|nr:hypothetical protein [Fuerstiella marisgermanici]APZ93163.1 hypothetical protein Fuma_02779 [Fuerstiella marisgermanici]
MTSNPYAPPESNSQFAGLPSDTEFLISDTCILCADEVALPKVCIYTGKSEDVIPQQSTLKWTPRWLHNIQVILVFLMFPAMSILQSGMLRSLVPTQLKIPFLDATSAFFIGIIALSYLAIRLKRNVMVTWYVSRQHDVEQQRRRRFWQRVRLVGLGALCLVLLASSVLVGRRLGFAFPVLVLTFLAVGIFKRKGQLTVAKPNLTIAGQHEGLNILTGFSPAFLLAVNAMIEEQR